MTARHGTAFTYEPRPLAEVLAIAYGKVFTRWKDEWDVPEVRVYRILENNGR